MRWHIPFVAIVLTTVGLIGAAGCATNPVTGERQFSLVSESQEIAMGQAAAAEVRQTIGLVDDRALQNYVSTTGLALARTSERPQLPWSFQVVDDPTPNAFALPGGFIFVTRGMLNLMDSQAELAAVLGHEIGHVTARHSATAISRQQLAQLGLGLGGIFFPEVQPFGQAIGAGLGLLFLKHGRDAERQADQLAVQYASAGNYDVRQTIDVFESLGRAGDEQRSALPAWLSTHPAPAERIDALKQYIAAPGVRSGSIVDRAEYLGRIEGLIYGNNPRQGFFRDQVFYHPDLRFRFSLPPGWQGQNLTQAVQAISQGRDAAMVLTLARAPTPTAAARQMVAQQNVGVLRSAAERINGLPSVMTLFNAATESGTVRGIAAHIEHGGRVYELIGYAPIERFGANGAAIERAINSFAPLTDRATLSIQPRRIDIVTLRRAMTVAEFAREYGSPIPLEELALINQVDAPNAVLAAGSLVKRVTGPPASAVGRVVGASAPERRWISASASHLRGRVAVSPCGTQRGSFLSRLYRRDEPSTRRKCRELF
jgi:predicted Zn-dependent protease